jgi:predicted dithiol-disulfide oxidoreductase (DUF899 family)
MTQVVSRDEWLVARKRLLEKEKEAGRTQDVLSAERRALPMVEIDKDYVFEGPQGKVRLIDMFEGREQLIVYHFMWLHDLDQGCNSCSFHVDNLGDLRHLHGAGTTLALVSRGPFASIERFRRRMGWTVPWYSSYGNDFNYDFHVSNDESRFPIEYNYMDKATLEAKGLDFYTRDNGDGQGLSVFVRDGDRVFNTYSTYGRGLDPMLTTYTYLDLTPLGRQRHIGRMPYHDQYDQPVDHSHHQH